MCAFKRLLGLACVLAGMGLLLPAYAQDATPGDGIDKVAAPSLDFIDTPDVLYAGRYGAAAQITSDSRFAAFSVGRLLAVYDLLDGSLVNVLNAKSNAITAIDFSPNGVSVAFGTAGGQLEIWDFATGIRTLSLLAHSEEITSLSFSNTGAQIASGSRDNLARVWNVGTGARITSFTNTYSGSVTTPTDVESVDLSSNGSVLLVSGPNGTLRTVAVATAAELRRFAAPTTTIFEARFVSSDASVLCGTGDGELLLWNATSGSQTREVSDFTGEVRSLSLSANEETIAAGFSDGTVRLVAFSNGNATFTGRYNSVPMGAVAISGNEATLLTASNDGTARIWDAVTGEYRFEYAAIGGGRLGADVSRDDSRVVAAGSGIFVRLWDSDTSALDFQLSITPGTLTSVAYGRDADRLVVGSTQDFAFLLDGTTGQQLRAFGGHSGDVLSVDLSPDGTMIVTGSSDSDVRIWDAETEETLFRFFEPGGSVNAVAFSSDGALVAAGSTDNFVRIWDTETGDLLEALSSHTDDVTSVAFSPDGAFLLSGSLDNTARLFSLDTGLAVLFMNHVNEDVWSVAFSPDGNEILTGASDGNSRVWDTQTALELRRFTGQYGPVRSVAYAPSGEWVISASDDESVQRWIPADSLRDRCENETLDSDGDGLTNCWELAAGMNINSSDTDSDGMPDGFEVENYLLRRINDANQDKDGDGLTNIEEFQLELSPIDPDFDDDGLRDGFEVEFGLDPNTDDADGDIDADGLDNLEEQDLGSSPIAADTDDDGMSDLYESIFDLRPTIDDADLDADNDDLSNIQELEALLNPRRNDTDSDSVPDGWELVNGTNPLSQDAQQDNDDDDLTNVQEFGLGSSPIDGNDPPRPVYVSKDTGDNDTGTGTFEKPFLTLAAAMLDVSRYTYLRPAVIRALPGVYDTPFQVASRVTIEGVGAETVFTRPNDLLDQDFITFASGSALRNCTVTQEPGFPVDNQVLVKINSSPVLDEVVFEGLDATATTALSLGNSASPSIINCTFRNLGTGMLVYRASPTVERCLFDNIRNRAIRVSPNASGSVAMPKLGASNNLDSTGFNRFRNLDGPAIELENTNGATLNAAYNDWGVYEASAIRAQFAAYGSSEIGDINIGPFIESPIEDGDLYIVQLTMSELVPIDASLLPEVAVGELATVPDQLGLALFTGLEAGTYSFTASADLHCTVFGEATLPATGIEVAVAYMIRGQSVPVTEGEIEAEGFTCDPEDDVEGEEEGEEPQEPVSADYMLDRFDVADANDDGVVTYNEASAGLGISSQRLIGLDTNRDGLLSFGELQHQISGLSPIHSADTNANRKLELAELLRVIQLYAAGGYACTVNSSGEDGYGLSSTGPQPLCRRHASDYRGGADGVIDLTETLRAVQLYNFGSIAPCPGNFEDNYCQGP